MAKTDELETLSNIFDEAYGLYNDINNTTQPTNSDSVQLDVKKNVKLFEKATRLVSATALFSTNELIDEIATNDIKYLLLPAFLGMLQLKLCSGDRRDILDHAEIYFKDFLKRCYDYGLTENKVPDKPRQAGTTNREKSESEIIREMVNNRQSKIQRYQEQKALEEKLSNLKKCFDDDVKREFYITLIKSFIIQVVEELKSIDMERPMLDMFQAQRAGNKPTQRGPRPPPLKPVIITRDEVQKAVFGAGYPSLPTMTVKEFYDKRVLDGVFPDPEKVKQHQKNTMSLQEMALAGVEPDYEDEDKEREARIESDDPDLLAQMRRKDEMKDEFRRGYGNRMNRS